jgi:hypothetical protein
MPKPMPPVKARKHIIPRRVRAFHQALFVVDRDRDNKHAQDLVIHFGREVPYRVVKLDTHGLPRKAPGGKPIHWIGNFGIVDDKGRYVDGVPYTLLLPALPENKVYVTYEQGQVHLLHLCPMIGPSQFVLAELALGDPPVGIKPREGTDPLIP